jgi:hypothetical protein
MSEKKLISLQQLVKDPEAAYKADQLKSYLNQKPPTAWVKENKYANNSKYLPIDKVELMMDVIFQTWKVEVKEVAQLFNGVRVTVRVHYKNPIDNEWYYHDGVGAKELQTKADTGSLKADFSNINKSAIEMALPIAKTNAEKDACHHIGKLFGRDLNRKDTADFAGKYMDVDIDSKLLEKGRAQ